MTHGEPNIIGLVIFVAILLSIDFLVYKLKKGKDEHEDVQDV